MFLYFQFVIYLNINLPFNLKQFFGFFDVQSKLPNLIKIILDQFKVEYNTPEAKDGFYTLNTVFMINANLILCLIAIWSFIFLASELIMALLRRKNTYMRDLMFWNGYFRIFSVGFL